MKKPSDPISTLTNPTDDWEKWREGILGFGERSSRKTYYAELQRKTDELERFQALVNKSHDAIFLIASGTGALVDVNDTACQLSGYTRPMLLCMTVSEILDQETVRQIIPSLTGDAENIAQHTIVTTLRSNDERSIPVEMSLEYVSFGSMAYVVAVARDITERLAIEEERDRLFKERTLIVEHVPVGLMFLKNRQCIWGNPALEGLFGYTLAELREQTTEPLYPTFEDYQEIGNDAYPLLSAGKEYVSERLMRRKDGTLFWCNLHGQAVHADDPDHVSIWIIENITERRRQQDAQQQLNEELERLVRKRTQELSAAYEEIRKLNDILKEENLRMSAELDVARRLQQMVLPMPEELGNIPGLDIVGYMQPAEEVGGDYYDVLHCQQNGHVCIGIGDVTGHGLESGVLMIMTQTAIRTLVDRGETDPAIFLNTLNRVLYENIKRMGADRSLTLAMVNYQEGQLRLIGQHEEALVVRHDGRIERMNTIELGFPLGMIPDIRQWVAEATVTLSPGDGVVLYTDGIPEAQNAEKEFYGLERLCAVISANWRDAGAKIVKDAIVADLRRFIGSAQIYDDVTLVILKQIDPEIEERETSISRSNAAV
ncbi:stage II sporulation protein E [Candidatus Moduliflexus flocculans]|uniref:Stage II sporulation protein E n=1 Tax=Candidatus Moduliflexus flocculans TaxID=1499966 RepID=A0A0S6VPL3_9BACT|nr:stage II sporulation protein E [Candidatus Moduliflexus flocculans]